MNLHKTRFVVGMWGDTFWSADFANFRDFLARHAVSSGYDMTEEAGFRRLKTQPKWLTKPWGDDLGSSRYGLPLSGGYIEPLDWGEEEFRSALEELDAWHAEQIKAAS